MKDGRHLKKLGVGSVNVQSVVRISRFRQVYRLPAITHQSLLIRTDHRLYDKTYSDPPGVFQPFKTIAA